MKRILQILLATLMLLGLCACSEAPGEDNGLRLENMPRQLLRSDVESLPVGSDDMTYAQRRQLCMDFMELQITAQWRPNVTVDFQTANNQSQKLLLPEEIYGGIVYHSKGFGNLYRWLEYYDETTGVMDFARALEENGGIGVGAAITDEQYDENGKLTYKKYRSMMTFGNQCSSSASWSWGRVINSVAFGDTCDINVYNGFIPVGCYTYGFAYGGKTYGAVDIPEFGVISEGNPKKLDTDDVIADWNAAHGENAMFACYAQLKPADCLVNQGHAMMVKEVQLHKNRDGSLDYEKCKVVVLEQVEVWSSEKEKKGIVYKQQGWESRAHSFRKLQDSFYIPFTFAEFLDPNDPQDKKHLDYYHSYMDQIPGVKARYSNFPFTDAVHGDGVEKAETYCSYTGESIPFSAFREMVVGANYSISDVFITVTDSTGKELVKNVWRADFSNYREVSMSDHKSTWATDLSGNLIPVYDGLQRFAGGENIIEVKLQLSTGQLLTAYKGILTES